MAKKIVFEVDIDTDGAVQEVNKIGESIEDVGKSTKKAQKGVKSFGKTLGNLTKAAGIVTILVGAFQLLKETLGQNQQVVDVFNTAMTAFGIAVNDLFTFITDNSQQVVDFFKDIFENPVENIKKFGKAIRDNIIERFESFIDTLGFAASALKKLFAGDLKGAIEDAGKAGKEIIDVYTGVNNSVDKIVKGTIALTEAVVDYTTATVKQASAIVQAEKSLVKLENQQTRVREQADRDAERQRQIRDDFTKDIDVRIAANIKLGEILEQQQIDELAAVDAQIAALSLRLALDKNNQDVQNQIFILNTERFAVEAQQEGFRSEQQINALNLDKEKLELLGFQTQAELEAFNAAVEQQDELDRIQEKSAKDKLTRDKKAADDAIKLAELEKNAKINTALSVAGAIGSLAEDGSKLSKAAAITQATIDTLLGVQSAFAHTPGGIIIKGLAAAAAGVIGAANIRKISQAKTLTASNPSLSAPSINITPPSANVAPPQFQTDADSGLNQFGDDIASAINQRPVKAFVVSHEIKSGLEFDRVTEDNATL